MTKKTTATDKQEVTKDDVGTVPADVAKGPETIQTQTSVNKSAIATAIFDECYKMNPVPQRKDILARVKEAAGLTDAGAATYLQNYKKKHGLSKVATVAEAAPAAEGEKTE